ncbi:MAG: hypothetical protein AAGG07_05690 [Planctomycetota bacterium]
MLRIRHLRIRVVTGDQTFGCDVALGDGLNVLHAPNSMGKSACLLSALYALGLEGSLSASHNPPVPHALKTSIDDDIGGTHHVVESWVELEIANGSDQAITLKRSIVGGPRDTHLVRVVHSPTLSEPDTDASSQDFFVRSPGAATHESGFHSFLATFLGLELPEVHRFDGSMCPLYLETLAPLMFVEQKSGWSGVARPMPTHLRIREVARRSVEFLLALDTARISHERQQLANELQQISAEWSRWIQATEISLRLRRSRLEGVPEQPIAQWPGQADPRLMSFVDDNWQQAESAQASLATAIERIENDDLPAVADVADRLENELDETRNSLREQLARHRALEVEDVSLAEELRAIDRRIRSLSIDLDRNADALKIQTLGGETLTVLSQDACPTCGQHVEQSLLPTEAQGMPMSIEENIDYLREQRRLAERAKSETERTKRAIGIEMDGVRNNVADLRKQVRSLQQSLVSDGRAPSAAAIREQMLLADRLEQVQAAVEEYQQLDASLTSLADRWRTIKARQRAIGDRSTSTSDRSKFHAIDSSLREQLTAYGFRSIPVGEIAISQDLLRPVHEGMDIALDLTEDASASDMIRIIWAYLVSLLEMSTQHGTNHQRLLVLDEPKQQGARGDSFLALLSKVASLGSDVQVVIATSEDDEAVLEAMRPQAANWIEFGSRILQPIHSS